MRQIQLRMKRITQMQLHANFSRRQLAAEEFQSGLVFHSRYAQRQLTSEISGHTPLPTLDSLAVDRLTFKSMHLRNNLARRAEHTDEQAARAPYGHHQATPILLRHVSAGEPLDVGGDILPTTQIEIAHAEIGAFNTNVRQD